MGMILSTRQNSRNGFILSITIDDVKASPDIVWETITGDIYRIPNISRNVTSIKVLHNNTYSTDELSCYDNEDITDNGKDHESNTHDDNNKNIHRSNRSRNNNNINMNKHEVNGIMDNDLERNNYHYPPQSNHINNDKKIVPMKEGLAWEEVRQFRTRSMKLHKQITSMETSIIVDDVQQHQHDLRTVRIHVQQIESLSGEKRKFDKCRKQFMKKSVKTESITVDSISMNQKIPTTTTNSSSRTSISNGTYDDVAETTNVTTTTTQCCRLIYTTVIVLPTYAYFVSCVVRKFRLPNHIYQYYYNELKQIAIIAEEKQSIIMIQQHQNQQIQQNVTNNSNKIYQEHLNQISTTSWHHVSVIKHK